MTSCPGLETEFDSRGGPWRRRSRTEDLVTERRRTAPRAAHGPAGRGSPPPPSPRSGSGTVAQVMAASRNGPLPRRSYVDPVGLRCLIVDDNPGFLQAARALLEQEGLRVVGLASTGAEAARRAAELHPDVTLVDIDLGVESGFEVVRRLFDDSAVGPGQLILISAHAEDDFADLVQASAAVGFIVKPALSATAIVRLLRPTDKAHDGTGEPVGH
jgi:CheY-like chemotaxis protein